MELYQLESFIAVVRTGSLSKAAMSRNISLSGISKHIKMLEEAMGVSLFIRKANGMSLTNAGREALTHAEQVAESVRRLRTLNGSGQSLRLGINLSPDFLDLARLKRILENHWPIPGPKLTVHNSHLLLTELAAERLDVCLAFGRVPDRFTKTLVTVVQLPLMIPTAVSLTTDLNQLCWITTAEACPFKELQEHFWQEHGITAQTTIPAQDLSRKEMVAQGLGIAFLEPQEGVALARSGSAQPHPTYHLKVPLWVAYRTPDYHPPAALLTAYLQECYRSMESIDRIAPLDGAPRDRL